MFGWSLVVGLPFTVIILKLSLSAGIIPGMVRSARARARPHVPARVQESRLQGACVRRPSPLP
jgi:hypothetical protein